MSAVDDLCKLLHEAGMKVTFDPRADITKPCWLCGVPRVPKEPAHDLVKIGTYNNGNTIRRPLCYECKSLLETTTKERER